MPKKLNDKLDPFEVWYIYSYLADDKIKMSSAFEVSLKSLTEKA